jgi:hypothetical protein
MHARRGKWEDWSQFPAIRKKMRSVWKPALDEIEDALDSLFIIEELDDGRFTFSCPRCPHDRSPEPSIFLAGNGCIP